MAADGPSVGDVGAAGQLGNTGQRSGGWFVGAEPAWCAQRLGWWPGVVVVGYWAAESKRTARENWQTAAVTKLRADMKLVVPYVTAKRVECQQGQPLEWWEYEAEENQQWFRVAGEPSLCSGCWEAARCPRHFAFSAVQHQTLFGLLPLVSRPAQRLLQQSPSVD